LPAGTRLYRIYFRGSRHPGGWNRFRDFGPLPSARFDHHVEPPRVQERAILYAAVREDAVATCVAEALQEGRLVDTRLRDPQLAAFSLIEDVPLLSLKGRWPTRAEASANINSGPRPRCRRWSSAIYEAYPDISGLLYASSMNANRPAVALYERAARSLPRTPDFNRPLSDAALLLPLERIASGLGYELV
ncbi:MAG: RES family NAD+ phosphorylase, partial [Rubrobacter sp.]